MCVTCFVAVGRTYHPSSCSTSSSCGQPKIMPANHRHTKRHHNTSTTGPHTYSLRRDILEPHSQVMEGRKQMCGKQSRRNLHSDAAHENQHDASQCHFATDADDNFC